jgi:hypothetical protein
LSLILAFYPFLHLFWQFLSTALYTLTPSPLPQEVFTTNLYTEADRRNGLNSLQERSAFQTVLEGGKFSIYQTK